MTPLSSKKKRHSIKLTPGKLKQIKSAMVLLDTHYGAALAAWPKLTAAQREEVLQHSPLLARLAELTRPMRETV